ncbi:Ribonucleases P/MRP protein subunit POP7 [Cyberlindnera fabianii]|uniref:Ribonucleases P/MRP protein subunit POP7 n=1 Tax=Cyberlindnera fabianii TaxID=36022 RepID=A0A1V2L9I6_CYBFA|nr:Ribonucleases P/MRP protein subunit POP7 [Cyberlindnera fabianii]
MFSKTLVLAIASIVAAESASGNAALSAIIGDINANLNDYLTEISNGNAPPAELLSLFQQHSDLDTLIHIQAKTPFVSALKRIDKTLSRLPKKQPKSQLITIQGMGKAMELVVSLAVHFQTRGNKIEVETNTVEVLDEFEQSDDESMLRKRHVSAVQVRIYKSRDLL